MTGSVLLRRVRIVPLDGGAAPGPVDVLVRSGRIAAVAPDLAGAPGVEQVDAGGRWAIPGLWDAHVHATQWVRTERMLDVSGAARAQDVLAAVARSVAGRAEGELVLGFGYRSAGWPRPGTVAELDAVSGGRPVVLISGDAHNGWLSSAALALLGAAPRTGPVREQEWFDLMRRLDELPGVTPAPQAFAPPLRTLAARGVTGLVDFEFGDAWRVWPARIAAGADAVRVRTAVYPHQLEEVIGLGLRTGEPLPGGGGLAVMGALKVISDGSLGTRTAWTTEPYSDGPASPGHPCGQPNYTTAELQALLWRAARAGLTAAVHAIGDRANATAVDAFAATGARGSIEHAQLIRPADVRRLAGLGVAASVQPAHLLDDRDLTDRIWGDRAAHCFPLRALCDAGVPLAFGSDAPVAPLDPWLAIATAVHRSADDRPAWHPEQSLSAAEALGASVDGRRVAAGGRGDVVLLDADPLAGGPDPSAAAARLRTMPVAMTVCTGRVTHAAL